METLGYIKKSSLLTGGLRLEQQCRQPVSGLSVFFTIAILVGHLTLSLRNRVSDPDHSKVRWHIASHSSSDQFPYHLNHREPCFPAFQTSFSILNTHIHLKTERNPNRIVGHSHYFNHDI
jgi:hypothetical protein